jgi:predicted Co/Zn/Cd cation transporter (cation efflux family)
MVKFLGMLDLTAAAILAGTAYHIPINHGLVVGIAVYLLLKALLFLMDIGSVLDIITAITLILSITMVLPPIFLFIMAGLVGLKAIMSLFA